MVTRDIVFITDELNKIGLVQFINEIRFKIGYFTRPPFNLFVLDKQN